MKNNEVEVKTANTTEERKMISYNYYADDDNDIEERELPLKEEENIVLKDKQ